MKLAPLRKTPTGIAGLDEITGGGFPAGRPTLLCGSAGCGKTLLATEFLVRGATQFNEPGVLVTFEESAEDLAKNVASLGFDLEDLIHRKKLLIDHIHVEKSEIEETGEYDLEGLFIRIGYAIKTIGAKRVVLDTIESLFGGLSNEAILRSEIHRLFQWLKAQGVTAVITGERGEKTLTRQGLEEYVSDCVILLDHRVTQQVSTRRLRIVKYRGSTHGTNEYPFLIDEDGISVLPVTSLRLDHAVSSERVSTGVPRLDTMLGGRGYFRGSSILVTGGAGTGKTSIASHFADATCRRGKRCLYFAFEESPSQILRNTSSIGIDLQTWVRKGLLQFSASRPTSVGLEQHLVAMHKAVELFKPDAVIVDPLSNLLSVGADPEVTAMLTRLIDYLKLKRITALFTTLNHEAVGEESGIAVSSLTDTWLWLRDMESNGERNRGLYILKSRGMAHSNQVREFRLSKRGIQLLDVYISGGEVLVGSARLQQEAIDRQLTAKKRLEREQKRALLMAQMAALRAELDAEENTSASIRRDMARHRQADAEMLKFASNGGSNHEK